MESLSLARERCEQRARRLVQVKFVSLPVELDPGPRLEDCRGRLRRDDGLRGDDGPPLVAPALLVTPAQAGAQFLSRLRNFVFRVIGRLEAARP
jgi:hypothetical protein